MKTILSFVLTLCCSSIFAQQKTKNIIIVTFDGLRWKEVFEGADSTKLYDKAFKSRDSASLAKAYWNKDLQERRKLLMPFFWNTLAVQGQLYGNRNYNNFVNTKNQFWFSYPGYNEMFSGYPDTLINSNGPLDNPNITVQEFINQQPAFKGKVAVFASWAAHNYILNEKRSGLLVNAGYEDLQQTNLTAVQKAINHEQHFIPKLFGGDERPDAITFELAKDYLVQHHPRVLQFSMIDTDAFGHQDKYDFYLDAAHNSDAMIAELWSMIQSDPFYKDQTSLFIAVDHGRGYNADWTGHGRQIPHSDEIWFAVLGPDTKPLGEVKQAAQLYQYQYAKTIAALLGMNFTNSNHTIGEKIDAVLK